MSKKNKIIVSIVGITIVLLALLGITYAYYLTRIEGNTNTNSISVTTADLKLTYSDGNEIVTSNNIMPGTTIGEKTFSVSNTGNSAVEDYKVVLEYAVIENVVPSVFVRPQDFEITMTCVSKNIETNEESGTCSGYTGTWNNESFEMTTNDIADNIKHEYTLTIFYANPDIDQSDDMGKNLNLKVQIYGANETSTITGTIDYVDETYAMKLNSNPKISTIKKVTDSEGNVKYQYKFIGVEPNTGNDSHTLTLVNKSNVEQSTGNITIKKGTNATIDGSTITVKDNQTNIFLTTTNGSLLTNSATFNPYSDNTNSLAYHILNNSINNKNGTSFLDTPKTNIAETISQYRSGEFSFEIVSTNYLCAEFEAWLVGDTPSAAQSGDSVSSYEEAVGKYVYDQCDRWTKYLDSYNSEASTVSFKSEIMASESTLSNTNDDYGISYFYRGNVTDNYVNFANMCWRIVRIAGDGSTKLILEDQYTTCDDTETEITSVEYTGNWNIGSGNFGEDSIIESEYGNSVYRMNYLNPVISADTSMVKAFYDFQSSKLTDYTGKLKSGDWCFGDKSYKRSASSGTYTYTLLEDKTNNYLSHDPIYYEAFTRLTSENANGYQPTLKCKGKILNNFENVTSGNIRIINEAPMYVSAITADEVVFAGGSNNDYNYNYYLINNYSKDQYGFLTLSPYLFPGDTDVAFRVYANGKLDDLDLFYGGRIVFRPTISLVYGTIIVGGEGTLEKPYVIG